MVDRKQSTLYLWNLGAEIALEDVRYEGEEKIDASKTRDTNLFKNDNDYNIIDNVYLNRNVNPYIINYKTWQSLGDIAAESPDEEPAQRLAFGNYDFDYVYDTIDKSFEKGITDAETQIRRKDIDEETRQWWINRKNYLNEKWSGDRREAYIYQAQSWLGQTDDVLVDTIKFAGEGAANLLAAGWDITAGWIPRFANHLSLNIVENAVNMFLFPANYAEQTRIDNLPELERKFEFDIMPGEGEINLPSLRGFDGSFNDYLGKNWAAIHQGISNRIREAGEANYTSRLMANNNFRVGAETVRDFWNIGKGIKWAKKRVGNYFVNNPTAMQRMEDILDVGYRETLRQAGKIKGNAQYLRARNARHNVAFVDKGVKGRELQRQFDIANNVLAWAFGAEAAIYDSKYSTYKVPTKKWDIPLFEFDTHAGILVAPVVVGLGRGAWNLTGGKVPQAYAQFQMNRIAAGWKLGTRKKLWGFAGEPMSMGDAINKYLLATRRILPEDLAKINETISQFDMSKAVVGGKPVGKDAVLDAARGTKWGVEDYLYNEWLKGSLQDARRVEATYRNPTDRAAVGAFLDKMEILALDRGIAKSQHDMFLLFDEMAEKGSPLAQNILTHVKTSLDTQNRLFSHFIDANGNVRPRYAAILEPSDINQLYGFFDQYTNLKMASNYRRLITDGGDLGPLGSRVDSILYNDLAIMLQQEETSLLASTNMLNAILTKLDDNGLPADDPLNIFLSGAQKGLEKQLKSFNQQKADLESMSSKLEAIQNLALEGINLSELSARLSDTGLYRNTKPKSVQVYDNTFKRLTKEKKNKKGQIVGFGSGKEGWEKLGTHVRYITDQRYDEIFGDDGIIAEAYNEVRQVKNVEQVQAPPVTFTRVGNSSFYESKDGKHVINGSEDAGYKIGRYGGDAGFAQGENFPNTFPTLEAAKQEVQSYENNLARGESTEATVTYEAANLQETLNRLGIKSGENVRDITTGEFTLRGADEIGWATQKHIVEALKEAEIWDKYGVGRTSHQIPAAATVDDLIAARSIINKKRWKDGLVTGAKDIDIHADAITDVLNQIPGFQRANEMYKVYAEIWKNDFGAKLREKQEGGNYVIPSSNIMEEFIKFGIQNPTGAADIAFAYFGPSYKSIVSQGFAHAIDKNRLNRNDLERAGLFLEEIFDKKLKITGQGEVAKDFLGRDIEVLTGGGGDIKKLIDSSKALAIELKLDIDAKKIEANRVFENTKNAEIQLDRVMFAISKGEERVVPFIKDFAEKSINGMERTIDTVLQYNPEMSIAEVKAGLLTGLKHTLMNDLVYGSNLSMKPAEILTDEPILDSVPTEGVFREEGLAPTDIQKLSASEIKVEEGRGWQSPYSEGKLRNPFAEGGVFNTKGFITYGDENIIKQLNKKELEWTDVLKGWNTALDTALYENATLIEFLTTGEGAVPFLKKDVGALKDLSITQRNLLEENLTLGQDNFRAPINVPRKWTAQQQTGFLNTYMKRITSRLYAISYASFQAIRMRNARFQVRMFTDPNLRHTMDMVFSGNASKLDPAQAYAARSALIASLPTVNELYPEEADQSKLAKYEHIREAAILDLLAEYGLAQKQDRITQLSDPDLIQLGKDYPNEKRIAEQLERLNLQ